MIIIKEKKKKKKEKCSFLFGNYLSLLCIQLWDVVSLKIISVHFLSSSQFILYSKKSIASTVALHLSMAIQIRGELLLLPSLHDFCNNCEYKIVKANLFALVESKWRKKRKKKKMNKKWACNKDERNIYTLAVAFRAKYIIELK